MHRQVGPLIINADGVANRGVLIRHLVMPGLLEETRAILTWIVEELGPDTYVNLMDQYRPAGKVSSDRFEQIHRPLSSREFQQAVEIAQEVGLRRLDERRVNPRILRRLF
jgi:putative pyruvate formate lyase activating enzyme